MDEKKTKSNIATTRKNANNLIFLTCSDQVVLSLEAWERFENWLFRVFFLKVNDYSQFSINGKHKAFSRLSVKSSLL